MKGFGMLCVVSLQLQSRPEHNGSERGVDRLSTTALMLTHTQICACVL